MAEAKRRKIDFSKVRDASGINPTHVKEGDYKFKITSVDEQEKDGKPMWVYILQMVGRVSATYPYRITLVENQLWKLRNLLVSAGKEVPKKAVMVDPSKIVGAVVGGSLGDHEYEGRMSSQINAVFPASELEGEEDEKESVDEDEDESEEADDEDLNLDEL